MVRNREVWFLMLLFCFANLGNAQAQDTLFFRDGTFATGTIKDLGFKKFSYLQLDESGKTALKKEKSSRLDSVYFQSGLKYRKGFVGSDQLPESWRSFASYWEGRLSGETKTAFSKKEIGLSYLCGATVLGIPYIIYKASYKPGMRELPTAEAIRYRDNPDFALGYRRGVRRTNLNALLPVYFAGVVSSLLVVAILVPR